jgi:predicted DNA-binding protein (MmcQ/YjbR family)
VTDEIDQIGRIGQLRAALSDAACALPGAHVDFPWGERVVKAGAKVFVFLGSDEPRASAGLSLKLRESHEEAMATPGARPTAYGLGKAGWVSIPITPEGPPLDALERWLLESYRIVAPKRLSAQLDQG